MSTTGTTDMNSINSILNPTTAQPPKKEDPLGRNAFLTMLVAQLKHQDPLNPMQGSDFSAQLAQFSSLEQLFNVNDNLETIKQSFSKGNEGSLLDYIGKEVLSKDNTFALKDGKILGANYNLDSSGSIVIRITDNDGFPIAELPMGSMEPGIHSLKWDGKGANGQKLEDGTFKYEVMRLNANGTYDAVDTGISGKITGVTFEQGAPYLLMGDRLVTPESIVKIWQNNA